MEKNDVDIINVSNREEFDIIIQRGFNPLLDYKLFKIDINLRVEIQREMFGHCVYGRGSNIMAANERFYRWIWKHKQHFCEECMTPLHSYSATFCSHILSRGAFPEMAHDPRNINMLCFKHHTAWEHGDRRRMRIYPGNMALVKEMNFDYQNLKRDGR